MKEAVIVSAVRTPLGSFNGSLGRIGATDLGGIVIEEADQAYPIVHCQDPGVTLGGRRGPLGPQVGGVQFRELAHHMVEGLGAGIHNDDLVGRRRLVRQTNEQPPKLGRAVLRRDDKGKLVQHNAFHQCPASIHCARSRDP